MASEVAITMFIILIVFLILALSVLATAFWIWMLVDAATKKFKNDTDKIVWVIVIVLTGIIGAIIYYFAAKRSRKN